MHVTLFHLSRAPVPGPQGGWVSRLPFRPPSGPGLGLEEGRVGTRFDVTRRETWNVGQVGIRLESGVRMPVPENAPGRPFGRAKVPGGLWLVQAVEDSTLGLHPLPFCLLGVAGDSLWIQQQGQSLPSFGRTALAIHSRHWTREEVRKTHLRQGEGLVEGFEGGMLLRRPEGPMQPMPLGEGGEPLGGLGDPLRTDEPDPVRQDEAGRSKQSEILLVRVGAIQDVCDHPLDHEAGGPFTE